MLLNNCMMEKLLKILEPVEQFHQLRIEILKLINDHVTDKNQIICQTKEENNIDWHSGIGSIDDLQEKNEEYYKFINPLLTGTRIEKSIKKFNGVRTRIMILPPRHCYSIHSDPTPRLHIPIVTNDQCWMIWPFANQCKRLIEGYVHLADTTQPHTFVNGSGSENRIHLMMCLSKEDAKRFLS